ncbi:hypothetical protein HOY80DRAFT_952777 [Tuber brumale]|nr:hypothetical protein HOY80DRAFT_952777 [Tuber brumale]
MDRCQISCTIRLGFWFKCHKTVRNRGPGAGLSAGNTIACHPAHGTLPTAGTNVMLH